VRSGAYDVARSFLRRIDIEGEQDRRRIAWWIATSGGLGWFTHWPGTVGAAAGAGLAALLLPLGGAALLLSSVALLGLGIWSAGVVQALCETDDPQFIVVDETFGALLTLALLPADVLTWVAGFIAFRLLDIAKPWPISAFHHQRGGLAIMLDDGAAALLAAGGVFLLGMIIPSQLL
jgi:phosphatidylglycerophosphatase A